MIIHKQTKSIEGQADKPNENWTGEDNYFVAEDGSDLAKKILLHSPYFDFVLGENGDLIDITPTERPPETPPVPTEFEYLSNYLLNVDMRLVMMELGL